MKLRDGVRRQSKKLADCQFRQTLQNATELVVPIEVVRDLLDAPSYADVRAGQRARTKDACVAADLLCALYLMDKFDLSPSLNKALHAVRAYAATTTYGDETRIPNSEPKMRSCWRRFGSVAPLWAAVRMNRAYRFAPERAAFHPEHLDKLLSVAAGIRAFAVSFIPKGARPSVPVLDPVTTWEMPEGTHPSILASHRFPDRLAAFLKDYVAPRNNAY